MTRAHGVLRGATYVNRSSVRDARFGRMFRWLSGETYRPEDLAELALAMVQREHAHVRTKDEANWPPTAKVEDGPNIVFDEVPGGSTDLLDTAYTVSEPGDENPAIPAGYTYFGQFIDHDLTFDPASSMQKKNDPDATRDFRTPQFDLDSLYGRGPDDQPYLYESGGEDGGIKFLLGATRPGELPRNSQGRALIGDPRNDENAIVCQLQVIFLHFHNRVVDTLKDLRKDLKGAALFAEAQRIVRWHYQYLVLTDYLPRIVGDATWRRVYVGSGTPDRPEPAVEYYRPKDGNTYMPVEFSVAAFRFGHSMVRPSYALRPGTSIVGGDANRPFAQDPRFHRIPIFSDREGAAQNLAGFGPLPESWEIDWNLFFCKDAMPVEPSDETADGVAVLQVVPQADGHLTQPGYRIDTKLVDPLAMLPPTHVSDGIPVLAYRNLLRGSAFSLPSGQNVARALRVPLLEESDLWKGTSFADRDDNPFAYRTPLWYYILKESETMRGPGPLAADGAGGHYLGPVGGRIVAEVLVGIALTDHTSYLFQAPNWNPGNEADISQFRTDTPIATMYDLIAWTVGDGMTFLPSRG